MIQRSPWCNAILCVLAAVFLVLPSASANPNPPSVQQPLSFQLKLRTRVKAFKGNGAWREAYFEKDFRTDRTAIVICDMWNNHWCKGAAARVNVLAERMDPVLRRARAAGIQVIHAPSETMDFYKSYPERQRMVALKLIEPPRSLSLIDPPLPVDTSGADQGCDTPDRFYKAWTRENPRIHIAPQDVISDNGQQIYTFLHDRGITNVFYVGVHDNFCILDRTFGIKQMTHWGLHCVLLRDLTDAMVGPKDPPHVSHAQGTEMIIEYIERYWCPSTLSGNLVRALGSTAR